MTFTIRVRSAGGPMLAEYMCPEHGRFEAVVDRDENGDPPAEEACCVVDDRGVICWESSPWIISAPAVHTQFVVSASRGRSDAKPHAKSMDTRLLAEGRKNEFRRQRKKIREQERHEKVKRLLS